MSAGAAARLAGSSCGDNDFRGNREVPVDGSGKGTSSGAPSPPDIPKPEARVPRFKTPLGPVDLTAPGAGLIQSIRTSRQIEADGSHKEEAAVNIE